MNAPPSFPLAVQAVGLITSVGLDAETSCAAFRAKLTNPTPTRFMSEAGEWIMAHQVPLAAAWRGRARLVHMAALAVEDALRALPRAKWSNLPLLLCVAEAERPGRLSGLDGSLLPMIEALLNVRFAPHSGVIAQGRVGVAVALAQARVLCQQHRCEHVLIVTTDSYLSWPTLRHFEAQDRLLSPLNANGFMPGEGAGALLVGAPRQGRHELVCTGLGFAREPAHYDSGEPLRGDGLSQAIKAALADAGRAMHDMDFRVTDVSGEQFYFKEAALALSRTLRVRKEEFDIWHPAECTGEIGASAGATMLALTEAACRKGYSKGQRILAHMANDAGQRAAITLEHLEATA
jgi:3-oxoacyl-[acyl-carrier-protein] synthase-1